MNRDQSSGAIAYAKAVLVLLVLLAPVVWVVGAAIAWIIGGVPS